MKYCVLEQSKICTHCGECDNRCELDPSKICDNCFRCLEPAAGQDYAKIEISAVFTSDDYLVEDEDDTGAVSGQNQQAEVMTLHGTTGRRKRA